MNRRPFAMFMLGVAAVLAVWAAAQLADAHRPFPSWRPAVVSPTDPETTPAEMPRTLRTATQGGS